MKKAPRSLACVNGWMVGSFTEIQMLAEERFGFGFVLAGGVVMRKDPEVRFGHYESELPVRHSSEGTK